MKMKLRDRILWQWMDYPIMTSTYLFNHRLCYGLHFPKCGSLSIEFYFAGGCIGYTSFSRFKTAPERWELDSNFNGKIARGKRGRLKSITIRLGQPVISIYFSKACRDKSLEHTRRMQIIF